MAAWRARARCMRSSQLAYASAPPVGLPGVGSRGVGSRGVPGGASRPLSLELIAKLLKILLSVRGSQRTPQELVHRDVAGRIRWDAVRAAPGRCAAGAAPRSVM